MANPRRNPTIRFTLPDVIDPEDRLCFNIEVPNNIYHIGAFRGALARLASAVFWQDDPDHKAKDVAAVWRSIVDDVEACIVALTDVRQNEENPCELEKQVDGGEWEQFANLQLCPPRIRSNEGKLQFFDGTNWIDLPGEGDEKFDGEADPPWPDPPPGEDGNCLAAENLVALLAQQVGEWENGLEAGVIAMAIVTGITGILTAFFIPFLTPAILAFATSLIALGAAGLTAAFTEEVYDTFKCIIACNANADGSITLDQYNNILDEIDLQSGDAWPFIRTWVDFFGPVGFTRAGASAGITTGDCTECDCGEWCYVDDFELGTQGWTANVSGQAVYASGVGWQQDYYAPTNDTLCGIKKTFPSSFTPTRMEVEFDASIVGGGVNGLVFGSQSSNPAMAGGTGIVQILNITVTGDAAFAFIFANYEGNSGTVTIKQIRFYGTSSDRPEGMAECP